MPRFVPVVVCGEHDSPIDALLALLQHQADTMQRDADLPKADRRRGGRKVGHDYRRGAPAGSAGEEGG